VAAAPARADDFYVDAASGSDANPGTSWEAAWQTISHAVASVPPGAHTVHIASGLYDAVLGETFPLVFCDDLTLAGEGEPRPVLDGGGAPAIVSWTLEEVVGCGHPVLENLALRNATVGVDVLGVNAGMDATVRATLRDVDIADMGIGVRAVCENFAWLSVQELRVSLERVHLHHCGTALVGNTISLWEAPAHTWVFITDSVVAENGTGLLGRDPDQLEDSVRIDVLRTRLVDNAGAAANCWGGLLHVADSVVARNGGGLGGAWPHVRSSTIAANAGWGVSGHEHAVLVDSTVFGNGDDIGGDVEASYCDIGDGDFAGMDGNISADPRFWAPDFGDYRLKADSPCIDAGDPASPPDPDGSRADMGAFAFDADYVPEPRSYCTTSPNSVGDGALMGWLGTQRISVNDFTLLATGCPPGQPGLFFYGPMRIRIALGDGYLCVGARGVGLFRLGPPLTMSATGIAWRLVDFETPPAGSGPGVVLPGSEWNFQLWYRDPLGPGGSANNLSDGLVAWFVP